MSSPDIPDPAGMPTAEFDPIPGDELQVPEVNHVASTPEEQQAQIQAHEQFIGAVAEMNKLQRQYVTADVVRAGRAPAPSRGENPMTEADRDIAHQEEIKRIDGTVAELRGRIRTMIFGERDDDGNVVTPPLPLDTSSMLNYIEQRAVGMQGRTDEQQRTMQGSERNLGTAMRAHEQRATALMVVGEGFSLGRPDINEIQAQPNLAILDPAERQADQEQRTAFLRQAEQCARDEHARGMAAAHQHLGGLVSARHPAEQGWSNDSRHHAIMARQTEAISSLSTDLRSEHDAILENVPLAISQARNTLAAWEIGRGAPVETDGTEHPEMVEELMEQLGHMTDVIGELSEYDSSRAETLHSLTSLRYRLESRRIAAGADGYTATYNTSMTNEAGGVREGDGGIVVNDGSAIVYEDGSIARVEDGNWTRRIATGHAWQPPAETQTLLANPELATTDNINVLEDQFRQGHRDWERIRTPAQAEHAWQQATNFVAQCERNVGAHHTQIGNINELIDAGTFRLAELDAIINAPDDTEGITDDMRNAAAAEQTIVQDGISQGRIDITGHEAQIGIIRTHENPANYWRAFLEVNRQPQALVEVTPAAPARRGLGRLAVRGRNTPPAPEFEAQNIDRTATILEGGQIAWRNGVMNGRQGNWIVRLDGSAVLTDARGGHYYDSAGNYLGTGPS